MDAVIAAGLGAEGPLRDRVSFRWWISFLMEGQGDYWVSDLKTPEFLTGSLWDTGRGAAHSPGSSHLPHAPPHSALAPTLPSRPPQSSLKDPHPTVLTGAGRWRVPSSSPPPHSLKDPALLQAVLATIPHGCIVHRLNGPVNGLEDILLQALAGGKGAQLDPGA